VKLIYKNRLIDQNEIDRMMQTPEGKALALGLAFNARLAYAATEALRYLGHEKNLLRRTLTETEENEFASILYYCLRTCGVDAVEKHVEDVWLMIQAKARQKGMPVMVGQIGSA